MASDRPDVSLDREAHDGLVDRADLLDVERAVGQALARRRRSLQCHQAFEDAQDAAVGDRQHARRVGRLGAAFEERELLGIEQLAAARLHEVGLDGRLMDQPEQREQPAPGAAPLVHGVGIERGVLDQAGVEAAHRIARLVDFAGAAVGARGQQVAVLGVEHEDEPHQDGEQALVEMSRAGCAPARG